MVLIAKDARGKRDQPYRGKQFRSCRIYDRSSVSSYAVSAVSTLVKAGIVKGSGNYINPLGYITRAEVAVILYRVLTR